MTTVFTLDDVLAVAKTLPRDAENTRFDTGDCRYAKPDTLTVPDCLVGTITHRLDAELFATIADNEYNVSRLPAEWRNRFDNKARIFLHDGQDLADNEDDNGHAYWGDAIDGALAMLNLADDDVKNA